MLLIGLVGYVLTLDYASRRQAYIAAAEQHSRALEDAKVYSTIKVEMDIPPNPLSLLSRGPKTCQSRSRFHRITSRRYWMLRERRDDLPRRHGRSAGEPAPAGLLLDRCRVHRRDDHEPVLHLLVFDSFSGEKEQGTLRVLLSAPVGRLQLLAGKYCGPSSLLPRR